MFLKRMSCFCIIMTLAYTGFSQLPFEKIELDSIPTSWDEGMPLGNGMLGALIWKKADKLRLSLDRADLWDSRPMKGLHRPEFRFDWVKQQVEKNDYKIVQEYFDRPYDNEPAPTKIPGAALEIPMNLLGKPLKTELDLESATCTIKWQGGASMSSFVSSKDEFGMFKLEHLPAGFELQLIPPAYEGKPVKGGDVVGGDDLSRLGYQQGKIQKTPHSISYHQEGWGGFTYLVTVCWSRVGKDGIEAIWKISSSQKTNGNIPSDTAYLKTELAKGYQVHAAAHQVWWTNYWKKSSISIPDPLLLRQWYLEQYKFGSASRKGAPPISLQAIWTADNGRIPPWKGDFHHDLNTQLSYWPAYSANHMDGALVYLDHLDGNKPNYKAYTKRYFGVEGLNVPGVTTLDGTEMGGWIQYSLSPTVSAWLSQHYYLQWRYSMDRKFLETRAYPWVKEVAEFLTNITKLDMNGKRQLPLSSSPEIHDNSISAWFPTNTNYDLALMQFAFKAASEMALALGRADEAKKWADILKRLDGFVLSEKDELMIAANSPYKESHRHFSHLMAIHPLGLIRWEDGDKSRSIINRSLKLLDSVGPGNWCGYSYAWEGSLKARAKDGAGAAKALEIFAKAFCSPNSFHLNGDQTKSGYSSFQYKPFTLEGNFAFAAGIQEMLLQSYAGFIEIMPAIPEQWKDVSFSNLRTEGAFLVDAEQQDGRLQFIKITATVDGPLALTLPPGNWKTTVAGSVSGIQKKDGAFYAVMKKGSSIVLKVN
jgi:alpha-L-fucosidase 2